MKATLKFSIVLAALFMAATVRPASAALVAPTALLRDPSRDDWKSLEHYNGTLTRAQFESRLKVTFDPFHGLGAFMSVTDQGVTVYSSPRHDEKPLARIEFARSSSTTQTSNPSFRAPGIFHTGPLSRPLSGLRVAIEPADIGGRWGPMEDRSCVYRGYGRIQEGDLNLLVARALRARLRELGAKVAVTRDEASPVSQLSLSDVASIVPEVLAHRAFLLPAAFHSRARNVSPSSSVYRSIAAEILLTKNLEARARAEKMRRAGDFDLTIVLQFDATPASCHAGLTDINRNIFFIGGAYTPQELASDARQRWKLLTKLLQNVTPTESRVAVNIARRFTAATGFPPVLYGDTATTRAVAGNSYVVARNLALNRENDGPVVVTEPYFMNQPVTIQRLLAGDFKGRKVVAGRMRTSIYHEYADAVSAGILDSYGKF